MLCIFIKNNENFSKIIEKLLKQSKISNKEIKNRLQDFLFNKIIIQFEK
ncbi:hypothetical protein IKS57_06235 [bacterium]|nr:hypothetical protein [bacterium]